MDKKSKFWKCKVRCDNPKCDWVSKDEVSIKEWHKKKCPKCKDCEIINDFELESIKSIVMAECLGLLHHKSAGKKGLKISIDFGSLRN